MQSENDAYILHENFVNVEIEKLNNEIEMLSAEITEIQRDSAFNNNPINDIKQPIIFNKISWPAGLPEPVKPINRFQVIILFYNKIYN